MAEKLPRKRNAATAPTSLSIPIEPRTAFISGAAYVTHGATRAVGEVASATVTAAGQVLVASINAFGECTSSFMTYMKEREITKQVVAQEIAATQRMQIWSHTVIAEAEARTEQVRISASLVLATINDKAKQRKAKVKVIQGFMEVYTNWNKMLVDALASRADRMPLDERQLLQQHIQTLLQRAREMEQSITTIAVTL